MAGHKPTINTTKAGIDVPTSFSAAMNSEHKKEWKEAAQTEFDALVANHTWELVTPPKNAKILPARWVFDVKVKIDGSIERFKGRFVVKGFKQVQGENFNDTYAATGKLKAVRLFAGIAARHDLELTQYDVPTAFLME